MIKIDEIENLLDIKRMRRQAVNQEKSLPKIYLINDCYPKHTRKF